MSIKIGFIGVGGIAQAHIQALQTMSDVEIVSVYDINEEAAKSVAEKTNATVEASTEELLNPAKIDAVYICTPQFARGDLEEIAAQRGIHLFAEKPLGLDMDIVKRKQAVILKSGILHSTGYCLRYLNTVQAAKEYLEDKEIHLIQGHRIGTSHPAKWWRQLHMSGGHLVDAVTHQVDMIRYVAGEFDQLQAQFSKKNITTLDPEGTIFSAGAMTFSMESGAVGTLTESCLSSHHSGSEIKVIGHNFFLHLTGNGTSLQIIDNGQNLNSSSAQNVYLEQAKAFVRALSTGNQEEILCGYDEGARTLAITLEANSQAI